jgi:hypothetical protein
LRIAGDVLRQEFQSDTAAKTVILGFVDNAHSAAAEFFDDAVMRDDLSDERG